MRLNAKPGVCQGHALCAMSAPDLVDFDDQGNVIVTHAEVDEGHVAAAEAAVAGCPESALELVASTSEAAR